MTTSPAHSFSIVICTDGRPQTLGATLDSLLHLDYEPFEVCVITGPTSDGTAEIVASYGASFKLGACPERNLSKARNIGIALAAGDVVAFLDDDAIPEPEWLTQLARGYARPEVGAVGGFVYDQTGVRLQSGFVTTDRLGRPDASWKRSPHELNFPYSRSYPHLLGTNASIRRAALLEIGGFDEEYEYFLDETDLCCRLVDHGYHILQLDHAFVHHKYAPGSSRDGDNVVRRWYPLLKNRVYFALKNGAQHHDFRECLQAGIDDIASWTHTVEHHSQPGGLYTSDEKTAFFAEASAALRDGIIRGLHPTRKLLSPVDLVAQASPFRKVTPLRPANGRLTFCFISQDYPPGQNGGIARYIHQLATTLGDHGHNVHVVTKSRDHDSVAFERDVWVHRVAPIHAPLPATSPISPRQIPQHIWSWSHSALQTIQRINQRRPVDVVYAPIWDCEGIAILIDGVFPLITSLQTTMRHWLDTYFDRLQDDEWMQLYGHPIMAAETLLMAKSNRIHAISAAIARDVADLYQIDFGDRLAVAPLGLADWRKDVPTPPDTDDRVRVLFVGRLEKRKGIDVLLDVAPALLERFPNALLDIVGDDSIQMTAGPTYRAQFESRPLPDGVRDRIRFHGRCDELRLKQFYAACDLFVAPSRYESFGLISLEAMIFGKPVVACHTGGIPEVVLDGVTGLLAQPGDAMSLENALSQLLSDNVLRRQLGTAGRARYETAFTAEAMAETFSRLLSPLLPVATERLQPVSIENPRLSGARSLAALMDSR